MNEDQDEINNLLAEREWEEFKKSSFGKFFTAKTNERTGINLFKQ